MGAPAVEAMTWLNFVTGFKAEFAPAVELQQLAREFLDMRQTAETVAEITAKFRERELLVPQYAVMRTWGGPAIMTCSELTFGSTLVFQLAPPWTL